MSQQQQPAQAQAGYYQNDMPSQGLSAGNAAGQPQTSNGKAPLPSPNYREEAERIVADERAQSEKMPVYEVCFPLCLFPSSHDRHD